MCEPTMPWAWCWSCCRPRRWRWGRCPSWRLVCSTHAPCYLCSLAGVDSAIGKAWKVLGWLKECPRTRQDMQPGLPKSRPLVTLLSWNWHVLDTPHSITVKSKTIHLNSAKSKVRVSCKRQYLIMNLLISLTCPSLSILIGKLLFLNSTASLCLCCSWN